MSKYNTIIFDLDGTLLDTSEGIIDSLQYVINKNNLPPLSDKQYREFIGPPIQKTLKEKYNLSVEEANKLASDFRERYSTVDLCKARLYPGMLDLLSYLKSSGYNLYVATYKRIDYTLKLLSHFSLDNYFNAIEGSDFEGKLTKKDIINKCIINSGCDLNNIIMIGDTQSDKIGAAEAGIDFLAVSYGFGYTCADDIYLMCNNCKDIIKYFESKKG